MTASLRRCANFRLCWWALLLVFAGHFMLMPRPMDDAFAAAQTEFAPHAASAPSDTLFLLTLDLDQGDPRWPHAVAVLGQVAPMVNGEAGSEALGFPVAAFDALWDGGLPVEAGTAATIGVIDFAEPRLFALIATSDAGLAWGRVQHEFRAAAPGLDDGQVFVNRLHGIDILLLLQHGETVLIAGMLGDTLMLATDFETATRLIAVSRGEAEPLSARPDYQSLAALASGDALATAFVDGLPALQVLLTDQIIRDGLGAVGMDVSDTGVIAARAAVEAMLGKPMMLRLDLVENRIEIHQHLLGGDAPVPPYDMPGVDRAAGDAWLYATGYDFAQRFYGPLVEAMEEALRDAGDDAAAATRQEARDAFGFDPELHAIELLHGPIAVALAPVPPEGVAWQLFAAVSDPIHARGTLAELDRLAARDGLEVERDIAAGNDIVSIGDEGSVRITHTVVGNEVRVAFTDLPASDPTTPPPLARNPAFQAMMERLPREATLVAVADVAQIVADLAPERGDSPAPPLLGGEAFTIEVAGLAVVPREEAVETVLILVGDNAPSDE